MTNFFINTTSNPTLVRFAMDKFFQFSDNYDPLTSYFATQIKNLPQNGYFTVEGEEGRPELVSNAIYGDTQYWWILLLYNNKTQFDEFKTGDLVNFPSTDSIESLFFSLKALESTA